MTNQERMQQLLANAGIPAKEIKVFGSSILITCYSRAAADKFAMLVSQFAKLRGRGVVECHDYAKENKGSCLCPTTVRVWRVGAAMA